MHRKNSAQKKFFWKIRFLLKRPVICKLSPPTSHITRRKTGTYLRFVDGSSYQGANGHTGSFKCGTYQPLHCGAKA